MEKMILKDKTELEIMEGAALNSITAIAIWMKCSSKRMKP